MDAINNARSLLADILGVSLATITAESTIDDIERWDSIAHLRVVLALEEKIGRQVTSEETTALFSVRQIAELLTELSPTGS